MILDEKTFSNLLLLLREVGDDKDLDYLLDTYLNNWDFKITKNTHRLQI
jgi:hypothetical protein